MKHSKFFVEWNIFTWSISLKFFSWFISTFLDSHLPNFKTSKLVTIKNIALSLFFYSPAIFKQVLFDINACCHLISSQLEKLKLKHIFLVKGSVSEFYCWQGFISWCLSTGIDRYTDKLKELDSSQLFDTCIHNLAWNLFCKEYDDIETKKFKLCMSI